jgi:hypothetical protein
VVSENLSQASNIEKIRTFRTDRCGTRELESEPDNRALGRTMDEGPASGADFASYD